MSNLIKTLEWHLIDLSLQIEYRVPILQVIPPLPPFKKEKAELQHKLDNRVHKGSKKASTLKRSGRPSHHGAVLYESEM